MNMVKPLSFAGRQVKFSQRNNSEKTNTSNKTINVPTSNSNLNATLLILAAIGAASLQSCSNEDILDDIQKPIQSEIEDDSYANASTGKKCDKMLKALGILDNSETISNLKPMQFESDDKSVLLEPLEVEKRYIRSVEDENGKKTLFLDKDSVAIKQTVVTPEKIEESLLNIKSNKDSLFVDKIVGDKVEKKLYTMNKQNDSISEFKYNNGFYVESSKLTKDENGGFKQIFPDGSSKSFTNIK